MFYVRYFAVFIALKTSFLKSNISFLNNYLHEISPISNILNVANCCIMFNYCHHLFFFMLFYFLREINNRYNQLLLPS